jgi:hypothetical protein
VRRIFVIPHDAAPDPSPRHEPAHDFVFVSNQPEESKMAKPAFAFSLRQRVNVPNGAGAQGVVTARTEFVDREPEYKTQTLTTTGRPAEAWLSESDLASANP